MTPTKREASGSSTCLNAVSSRDLQVDLLAALSDMEGDGLLRAEEAYYYSTTNGKIALRNLLVRKGLTTAPVADQKKYLLADLVLAITAHDNVEHGVQMSFPTREMTSVYLHEFDVAEVAEAVDRLIEAGHARRYEFGDREGVAISGEGLQHYQEEVCQRLNLEPGHWILRLAEPVELDGRLARLGLEPALVANLQQRWREMEICVRIQRRSK